MLILLAFGLAKLQSRSAHQDFCRRIGFIPRARGRARRRAARDFLKTIVAMHKLETRDALTLELEMQLLLYIFCQSFRLSPGYSWSQSAVRVSHNSFSEFSLLTLLIQSFIAPPRPVVVVYQHFQIWNTISKIRHVGIFAGGGTHSKTQGSFVGFSLIICPGLR